MAETISFDQIEDQRFKAVHILAGCNAGSLTLIGLADFLLLLPGFLAVSPEGHRRLTGLPLIICQIQCHASVSSF
ncbi:hypothetical protein [Georhizobium profundi]|uniref:hypothetical protein n=1 Tax=Georhizobium profundi TaxID=2341112 RepID=UPI002479FF60|nr:hypothetical protein [Georhizobium profundi]